MTAQLRLGLIAAGIVTSLAALGLGVAALGHFATARQAAASRPAAAGGAPLAPSPGRPEPRPAAAGPAAAGPQAPAEVAGARRRLAQEVAQHRYWKVAPPASAVERLAEEMARQSANTLVFIDDHFRTRMVTGKDDYLAAYRVSQEGGVIISPPEGIGERCLTLDLQVFDVRPGPEMVLRAWKDVLDRAEFRQPR